MKKLILDREKHYRALELDAVLKMLAVRACNDDVRDRALSLRPETDINMVHSLLRQTEDAYILLAKFGAPSFGGLKNVNNSLARANSGGTLSMKELLDIGSTLRCVRAVREWRERNGKEEIGIDAFFGGLTPNKYLEEKIFSAILSEEEISDNASPELSSIRRKIKQQENNVRSRLDQMIRSQAYKTYLQDAIITQRNGRYVVPVKAEQRANIQGLVHDTSSSGATVFIEPAGVVEANNEIRILRSRESEEIDRILSELSADCGGYEEEIKNSYACAVELNLIFCKAQLAYQMKASVPELNGNGIIDLKRARHPLIAPESVVAADIQLGESFDTLVVTGPNTGGKTVAIKTIGLLTLMAMCGLMIPAADQSRVSVFTNVFADIGDEQSIEQSLSTFSSHMVNIVSILENADSSSLVLIDELGAGTDPVEGAALAMAILERLHEKGAKVAATTHYAELKAYALETDRVENGSCEFNVNTLQPTYRLLIGIPGRSNAFAISERLGVEPGIIGRARELVSAESTKFEDVVDSLERSRLEMEHEKLGAEATRREADEERLRAEKLRKEAEKLRDSELERAKGDALKIVENAKREANMLLLEVEKLKKEAADTKDAAELARRARSAVGKHFASIDEALNPVSEDLPDDDGYVLPRELVPGDTVFCRTIGKNAVVSGARDKKGMYEITAGMLKMRAREDSLRLITEVKKEEKKVQSSLKPVNGESRASMAVDNRCDLRGLMVDEALPVLDSFLDRLFMSGLKECTIIHGKGTGALRTAVQKHLRNHPQIKSFRLGTFGEGENGVTIAELK